MNQRLRTFGIAVAALVASVSLVHPALAQKVNCANEFRSGKLYFSQKVYDKAVEHFAASVEACPDKGEYRARYAMALAQRASEVEDQALTTASTKEEQNQLLQSAIDMYTKAGAEFDSSLVYDDGKKNQKFVRENRQHYWVDHYNQGLQFATDGKYDRAARQLMIARLIDPNDSRAYTQGAVVLIKADRKTEAADLVQQGLTVDPQNEELNKLLQSIFVDAARKLIDQVRETESGAAATAKADSALDYLNMVQEKRGEDPNVYFDRGLANLELGSVIARGDTGEVVSPEAKARFVEAAKDFGKAAEMVPAEGENRDFHVNALFNRMQALLNAQEYDEALAAVRQYLALEPTDAVAWQSLAQVMVQRADQEGTVNALVVSKSLAGNKIEVDQAVANAQKEEKDAVAANGNPDAVYTFQEQGSGDQINTWFWFGKKLAMSFKLGLETGRVTW